MTFRIESITDLQDLSPYAEQWNDLAFHAPQRLPMLSHAWVASYLEHRLSEEESWRCLLAFENTRLIGILPYVRSPHPTLGKITPILRTPRDDHTVSGDVLLSTENPSEVLSQLLGALRKHEPRQLGLNLQHLREGSLTIDAFKTSLPHTLTILRPVGRGSYLKTHGDLDIYTGNISKNFRASLRKSNNKFSKLDDISYKFITGDKATESSLTDFLELEASGWKGQGGTAIACNEDLADFYRALARRLAECGWLEWHFIYANDELLAAHFAIRMNRSLILPKIAYNEKYASCSPGNLLFKRMIERAFESDTIDEINCLTDYPWHRKWNMQLSNYYTLWVFPYRPLSLLLGAFPRKARLLAAKAASVKLY